jgi:tetratricopeptide (TPR) repeat protein
LRLYLCLLALVAPLKFGSAIGPAEIPLFPVGLLEWVFGVWPPFLLGGLAGIGLLWAVVVCSRSLARHSVRLALWAWSALLLSCVPGLLRTTEWDYAVTFFLYLCGVCAFLAAALLVSLEDERFRRWLLAAVAAGTLLCGLNGWHQRLWGFAEMRRFAQAQALEQGREWSVAMQGKFLQTRVHRPFFHPNSYAAHLVLTGPLALLALWRIGRRVEPRRLSQWLFVVLGSGIVFGALVLSQSRAAQLALGGGVGLAVLGSGRLRRWRWPLLAVALGGGLGLMFLVNAGRDLLSAGARFHYYRAALVMFRDQPLTGVGLGEFFPQYLLLKPFAAEETRVAHNLVLEMLSQAGGFAGLAALLCVLLPAWFALGRGAAQRGGDELLALAAVAGLGGWGLHALLDFNLQIPPTVMIAAVLPLFCWRSSDGAAVSRLGGVERSLLAGLAVVALLAWWRVPGERAFRLLADGVPRLSLSELGEETLRTARVLPLSPEPWATYGRESLARGRPAEAAEAFRQALLRAPHRSALQAWRGQALLLAGDVPAAAVAAREAWTLYPGSPRAMLLSALLAWLQSGEVQDVGALGGWIGSALSCQANLICSPGEIVVELSRSSRGPPGAVSLPDLCRGFSALGLRTPGPLVTPVGFRPAGGAG